MAGSLDHSPSDVIQALLIELGLGSAYNASLSWPVYSSMEPSTPDNCITVFDTSAKKDGRLMFSGEVQEHHGVQIRIRGADHRTGYAKARAIAVALDEDVLNETVAVGSDRYLIHAISRPGDVIALGKEQQTSRRIFTLNVLATITQSVNA